MKKPELLHAITAKTAQTKSDTKQTLNALLEDIEDTAAQAQSVSLLGFGAFKSIHRGAREGRNPAAGEFIPIAASTVPKFIPGAHFKAHVNGD